MAVKDIDSLIKTGVRSLATICPFTAPLAQAWNEYETKMKFLRIEEFFTTLNEEFKRLEDRISNQESQRIYSEDFPSLIERVIEKVQREYSLKKRQIFAHLLTNMTAIQNDLSYDEKITFIESLDALTDQDIFYLSLFEPNKRLRVKELIGYENNKQSNYRLEDIVVSFSKLESRGLIIVTIGKGIMSVMGTIYDKEGWEEKYCERYYELTPHGAKFSKVVIKKNL